MTAEQQAEKLIDEAYQYAPSSGGTKEAISIMIAIWCAEKIASSIGFSVNDEYWSDVIKYLNNKNSINQKTSNHEEIQNTIPDRTC